MRRLGNLYQKFREAAEDSPEITEGDASNMFRWRHFKLLETAIKKYTEYEDGSLKPGLKMSLYYLLKTSSKILKGEYLTAEKDAEAQEVTNFVTVLELNHDSLFGDAIYAINRAKNMKLRKPQQMPNEEDIMKVRQYSIDVVKKFTSDDYIHFEGHEFKELRDAVVCRLTLFNARRGGEPSRMQLKEWEDAVSNAWVDQRQLDNIEDPIEKAVAESTKVTYQTGKGNNHLVPVLIPNDIYKGMEKLADTEIREQAGVAECNQYLFANTQDSDGHVIGWHAINSIATEAKVANKELMTATKMRHRISTMYAALDVPQSQREAFYEHMGHSENINKTVYQAPRSVVELTHVGACLKKFDTG